MPCQSNGSYVIVEGGREREREQACTALQETSTPQNKSVGTFVVSTETRSVRGTIQVH